MPEYKKNIITDTAINSLFYGGFNKFGKDNTK